MSIPQKQLEGLKQRTGDGFGIFGREGSVIRWAFNWADTGLPAYGYNQGVLKDSRSNKELLAIIKAKIFNGLFTRNTVRGVFYPEAIRHTLDVFLLGETAKKDILLFTLKFFWVQEGNKRIRDVSLHFSESIKNNSMFGSGELSYIEEMFFQYQMKITNRTPTSALSKLDQLAAELKAVKQQRPTYEKYDVRRFASDQQQQAIKYCTDITTANAAERPACIQYYSELCDIHNWVKPTVWQ